MKALEDIRQLFDGLPAYAQESILDDLLQEFEVKGKVLELAYQEKVLAAIYIYYQG